MKSDVFIGRTNEYNKLKKCYEANNSQLVIVSGRKGVGKTYLIDEVFQGNFTFRITGSRELNKREQLKNFIVELNRVSGEKYKVPGNWTDAFELLREYLDSFDKEKRLLVFFDELPWFDNKKSNFLPSFEYFWNNYGSSKRNLMFIVCGSSASWIEDKILQNKGGLFNRHNAFIVIHPFSLNETEEMLMSKNINWSRIDIVRAYMILGGIPYYLNYLDGDYTLNENIDHLFFTEDAILKSEFNILFSTQFTTKDDYVKVVTVLSETRKGLTRKEISNKTKLQYNGVLTKILYNLAVSGIIKSYYRFEDRKEKYYILSDFFTLFYLRFLKSGLINDSHYWSNTYLDQSRKIYESLAFELLCFNSVDKIKDALSIGGVLSTNYSWSKRGDGDNKGAQIDLVIDRKDNVITICEIKFYNNEFTIDSEYASVLRNKIQVFQDSMKKKKSIQLVLVSTYGLKKNSYSNIINRSLNIDDLF